MSRVIPQASYFLFHIPFPEINFHSDWFPPTREAGYLGPMEEYVDKTMYPVATVILGMNTTLKLVSISEDLRDTVWGEFSSV